MRNLIAAIVVTSILAPAVALAAKPAKPLGFELGKATLAEVRADAHLPKAEYVSSITKGLMLKAAGDKFEVPDLKDATFIFGHENKLQAVILTFPKQGMGNGSFDKYFGYLDTNYKLKESKRPFVGNQFARFEASNGHILLESMHMSFEVNVIYETDAFTAAYNARKAREKAQRKKAEGAAF